MTRFSNSKDSNRVSFLARIFATERAIEIPKIPSRSARTGLPGYVSISILIKCGEWLIYPKRVTLQGLSGTTSCTAVCVVLAVARQKVLHVPSIKFDCGL